MALDVAENSSRQFFQLNFLASITSTLRDRESAKAYLSRADNLLSAVRRGNLDWGRYGNIWQAALNETKGNYNFAYGYLNEALTHYRTCTTATRSYLGKEPNPADDSYYYLPQCLGRSVELAARLGYLREAGAYVNDVQETARAYARVRQRVLFETRQTRPIARVYLEQGLLHEAKELLLSTISRSEKFQQGEASLQVADAWYYLGLLEMSQGNWAKADDYFRARRDGLRVNKAQADERDSENISDWGYTLLRLGKTQEALAVLDANLSASQKQYDDESIYLWDSRAFHALGIGATGDQETAVKTLAVAIPKLLELGRGPGSTERGYLTSTRIGWIMDGYVALLADLHRSGVRFSGIEPYVEAFRIADLARGSRVEKALSAAILRASINDPQLAAVMRRAQDLDYQVKAISEALSALQDFKSDKADPNRAKLIEKTRADLARVRDENEQAQVELKRKLPDYSELLNAKPVTIADTQKLLKPQEALVSIYTTQKQTLVWAMSAQGQPAFQVVDLPAARVTELVTKLRKSLDPSEADIGQVPTFDFTTAHELYQKLLTPVEAGWKNAKELIIVPHGALSELPFSVLLTAPYQPNKVGIPFSDHGAAPWLIKNAAISYLPSLSALTSLRRGATPSAANSFIGFGDPVFGAATKSATVIASRSMIRRNSKLPTAPSKPTSSLELLQALPDTADEVREIAKILKADENRDVHLGSRASEQSVKSADLSNYRVVMFATHGLVPGELPDLAQPALALSNPIVTGEKEDGLLTLAEILGLKLKADWVVLSACNTASADGQASEAVSGLGRAFFYAGAKALLVSHWPVETVSAKLLTRELFKRQTADANLSRAQAMREASLAVMQQSAGKSYSYAHPMFWAPFAKLIAIKVCEACTESEVILRQPAGPMFSPEQLAEILALPFFAGLDPATLDKLLAQLEPVHLPGGTLLFGAGAPGDSMYIVLSGRLRVAVEGRDGSMESLRELARGDTVGELALLTGETRSAAVRAIRDSELVKISRTAFESAVKFDPKLLNQIAVQLAGRERQGRDANLARRNLRTIALVPAQADVPWREFVETLAAALQTVGPTICLHRETRPTSNGAHQSAALSRLESSHRFVLYQADSAISPWTELCVRQADLILVVGSAESDPTSSDSHRLRQFLEQNQITTAVELVLLHHGRFNPATDTARWRTALDFTAHHHVAPAESSDIDRLVRNFTGSAIGLVLSGGGARGFAHIGVLRALSEKDIPVDYIGGTSMGAVIAAQYALGWDWQTMAQVNRAEWPRCHPQKNYTLPLVAINSGKRMDAMLARMLGDAQIENLRRGFFCVSTNLTRAQAQVHRQGSLWKAVRASVSIPGIGPPAIENGEIFVDGGLIDNLPVEAMKKLCQGQVLAVDVSEQAEFKSQLAHSYSVSGWKLLWQRLNPFATAPDLPNILQTLYRTTTVAGVRANENAKSQADLCFQPPVSQFGVFEWHSVDKIIEVGYRYAIDKLNEPATMAQLAKTDVGKNQ